MNNHRIIAIALFITSCLAILLGYVLYRHPELLGLCGSVNPDCLSSDVLFGIAQPLYLGLYWLPPLFFFLIFVHREVFFFWLKAISVFTLLGLILIMQSPDLPTSLFPARATVTEWVVHVLVILSLVFIAVKYAWLFREKQKTNKVTTNEMI